METTILSVNKPAISEKIQAFVLENTFGNTSKITAETLIFQEGYFDSMGFVSLISFLEEAFGIQTETEDLVEENFESINAVTKFVTQKMNS
jgi:acyl carrier protein